MNAVVTNKTSNLSSVINNFSVLLAVFYVDHKV